jgi:hypothetical protein
MKAALVLATVGLALVFLAVAASTDAFTVLGTIFGFAALGIAIQLGWESRPRSAHVSDRTLFQVHRDQDRSRDVRAPRSLTD